MFDSNTLGAAMAWKISLEAEAKHFYEVLNGRLVEGILIYRGIGLRNPNLLRETKWNFP